MTRSLAVIALFSAMILSAPAVRAQDADAFSDPTVAMGAAAPAVQIVSPADVLKLMQDKDAKIALVDTQPADGYAEGHIRGAINYPWVMRIKSFPIALPRNKTLIFYGSCPNDTSDTVKQLAEFGYTNVKIMDGGLEKWIAMKYPVARSGASAQPTPDLSQLTAKPATAVAQVADSHDKSSAAK